MTCKTDITDEPARNHGLRIGSLTNVVKALTNVVYASSGQAIFRTVLQRFGLPTLLFTLNRAAPAPVPPRQAARASQPLYNVGRLT